MMRAVMMCLSSILLDTIRAGGKLSWAEVTVLAGSGAHAAGVVAVFGLAVAMLVLAWLGQLTLRREQRRLSRGRWCGTRWSIWVGRIFSNRRQPANARLVSSPMEPDYYTILGV